jgi:tetratricopeptide (TPR) repeat protein
LKVIIALLSLLLFAFPDCQAQEVDANSIIKRLKDQSDQQVLLFDEVIAELQKTDSNTFHTIMNKVKEAAGNNSYLQARSLVLEADLIIYLKNGDPSELALVENLYEKSLKKALELNDELLIALVCRSYAMFCNRFELFEKAMFYSLKSIDLQEKNGLEKFDNPGKFYLVIGDILYKVGEYDLCIRQLNKGLALLKPPFNQDIIYIAYNTVALAYQKTNKYDSAINWYRQAMPCAKQNKDTAWEGITTGNIGDVYFLEKKYDSAKYYLLKEFELTRYSNAEKRSPYNSMLMVARILAMQGKPDSGLKLIKEAEPVLFDAYYNDNRNIYKAKEEVFRAMNRNDSAGYYAGLFQHQDDSIKERMVHSKMDVTMMRLNYEKSRDDIAQMLKEKKREKEKQYLLMAGIVLALVIGFVIYRQQMQRNRLEKELLLQQKKAAEETSLAAGDQLDLFTANFIEKNEMIEKLQSQLLQQNQSINDELLSQTILTDEDWVRFKTMFEKARPGFFEYLQNKASGITPAELRLAALLALKLDTKNIAAMQGISSDAVRKSKSRLRQRLNITLEEGLEDFIRSIG